MILQDKTAIVYGGAGAIGGAIARTFAREGATVCLVGRTQSKLDAVVRDIVASGGRATAAAVDAMDQAAVERHADSFAADAGRIDISVNAVGIDHVQGPTFLELSFDDVAHPVSAYVKANFLTARAAARHMVRRRSGVLLTLSTPGARLAGTGFMGNAIASSAVESLTRQLAGELGAFNIRAICLRPDAIPEAVPLSHTGAVFGRSAEQHRTTIDAMLDDRASTATLLKRLPTLAQVAEFAAFAASDRAGAMTGAIANLTCGSLVD